MKKMNNYWGGEYAAPALEVLDVTIENGFAASPIYGDEGEAGQEINEENYDVF